MGVFPVGLFSCVETEESYGLQTVGWLEQCWYIIRYKLRELFRRRR